MKKELMGTSNLTKPENAETGRTMVEMLGTLAIIGILSIGGVTGYGRAIKTYRTNSAVETAQRQAAIVAGEVGLGQAVSPGSATVLKAPAGYEVAVKNVKGTDTDITSTSPYFGVEIGGNSSGSRSTPLQSEVAKEMLERAIGEWKNVHAFGVKSSDGSSITWLNSTGSGDHGFEGVVDDAKTVVIIVVYASDLSLRPETGLNVKGFDVNSGNDEGGDEGDDEQDTCTKECGPCQKCENGSCVTDESMNGQKCSIDDNTKGICTDGSCGCDSSQCCSSNYDYSHGWTGDACLFCGSNGLANTGGSVNTACACNNAGIKLDGSCCMTGYGWNGSECMDCNGGMVGTGGTIATACSCSNAGKNRDGSCCMTGYGWNGSECVDCSPDSSWSGMGGMAMVGTGGTIATACSCPGGRKSNGGCCASGYGWNGSVCIDCNGGMVGTGGTIANACSCNNAGKDSTGRCCMTGYGWNGSQCVSCDPSGMGSMGMVGAGGTIATACSCPGGRKSDGSCCMSGYGWNGSSCVSCSGGMVGTGGTIATACSCPSARTSDGSCCMTGYGWNGSQCVSCMNGFVNTGGTIATACTCNGSKNADGSCSMM